MIDDVTIKRVAQPYQWLGGFNGWTFNSFAELIAFARAIEQLARQEQREEDARIAESLGEQLYCVDVRYAAEAIRAAGKENSNESP